MFADLMNIFLSCGGTGASGGSGATGGTGFTGGSGTTGMQSLQVVMLHPPDTLLLNLLCCDPSVCLTDTLPTKRQWKDGFNVSFTDCTYVPAMRQSTMATTLLSAYSQSCLTPKMCVLRNHWLHRRVWRHGQHRRHGGDRRKRQDRQHGRHWRNR